MVNENWLNQSTLNQDITKRFVKATLKGWMYCRDFPQKCVDMLYDRSAHQQFQMHEINKLIWPSIEGVGKINETQYNKTVSIGKEFLVNSTNFDAYDMQYVNAAIHELTKEGFDVYGTNFSRTQMLRFCPNQADNTFYICDENQESKLIFSIVLVSVMAFIFCIPLWIWSEVDGREKKN